MFQHLSEKDIQTVQSFIPYWQLVPTEARVKTFGNSWDFLLGVCLGSISLMQRNSNYSAMQEPIHLDGNWASDE